MLQFFKFYNLVKRLILRFYLRANPLPFTNYKSTDLIYPQKID